MNQLKNKQNQYTSMKKTTKNQYKSTEKQKNQYGSTKNQHRSTWVLGEGGRV